MRPSAIVRAVYGALLLLSPRGVVETAAGESGSGFATVRRVLGARHLVQAAATGGDAGRTRLLAGVVVDLLHAASMLPVVALGDDHRRGAAVSALVAAVLSAVGLRAAFGGD